MHRYCRADVLRILHITAQQLAQWQKAGLVSAADSFTFFDLLQLRKIRDLRAKRVRPAVIRQSLEAMQKQVSGMANPLIEAGTFSSGARIIFRHDGRAVDPTNGQLFMDFAHEDRVVSAKVRPLSVPAESAAEWFARGVAMEDDPGSQAEAVRAYEQVLEMEPAHAAAHINLGTIHYNARDFDKAEHHYRAAIEADPRYALAYFDLGNVLDETGRIREAIETYRNAIAIAPTYADAHYNLALAYEKMREPRRALRHWRSYIKIDNQGAWAAHARNQIRRILSSETLKVVYRRPRTAE